MCSVKCKQVHLLLFNETLLPSHHITSHHTVWNITQEKSTLQHCLCLCFFFHFLTADLERVSWSYVIYPSSIRVDCHMPIIYLAPQREKTSTTAFFTLYSLSINHPSRGEQNLFICCDHSFLFDILFLYSKESKKAR